MALGRLHAADTRALLDLFGGMPSAVAAPGRLLLFQEPVDGCKTNEVGGKVRPYYAFLMNDAVAIGKEHIGLVSTSYRGHAYPLRLCHMWIATEAEGGAAVKEALRFPLRVSCAGRLTHDIDTGAYATADSPTGPTPARKVPVLSPGEVPAEYTLFCRSKEQREKLLSSFQFLKRRIAPDAPVSPNGTPPAAQGQVGFPVATAASRAPMSSLATGSDVKLDDGGYGDTISPDSASSDGSNLKRTRAHANARARLRTSDALHGISGIAGDRASTREEMLKAVANVHRQSMALAHGEGAPTTVHAPSDMGASPAGLTGLSVAAGEGLRINVDSLPPFPPLVACDDADARHRYNVYTEMYDTERTYVRDLQIAVGVFKTLLKERATVPDEDIAQLFGNMDVVLDVNTALLLALVKAISTCAPDGTNAPMGDSKLDSPPRGAGGGDVGTRFNEAIAAAFTHVLPFFRVYTQYVRGYTQALRVYGQLCEKNESFKTFLTYARSRPDVKKRPLDAFLILPVQRICKYPLLFKEVLKKMAKDDPNRDVWQSTYTRVDAVAGEVNARIADEQQQSHIFDVYTLLDGSIPDLVQPFRRFIMDVRDVQVSFPDEGGDGILAALTRGSVRAPRPFRVFICNDVMIIAAFSHTAPRGDDTVTSNVLPGVEPLQGVPERARYTVHTVIPMRTINTTSHSHAHGEAHAEAGAAATPARSSVGGGGSGPGDDTTFDIMATKQVAGVGKDAETTATTVSRVRFHCANAIECARVRECVYTHARASQDKARELHTRQINAAPSRTRAWKRRTTTGVTDKTLDSVRARYSTRVDASSGETPAGGDTGDAGTPFAFHAAPLGEDGSDDGGTQSGTDDTSSEVGASGRRTSTPGPAAGDALPSARAGIASSMQQAAVHSHPATSTAASRVSVAMTPGVTSGAATAAAAATATKAVGASQSVAGSAAPAAATTAAAAASRPLPPLPQKRV